MDVQAHIERDMASLGCKNHTNIALAIRLYFYLVDIQRAHDVEYCYSAELDQLYCLARPGKGEKVRLYVPMMASKSMTMRDMKNLQLQLCTVETGPSVNIAFIESDSTVVIYNLEAGLAQAAAPSPVARKNRVLRRQLIDKELRKRTKNFMEEALDGGNVDDDDVVMTS